MSNIVTPEFRVSYPNVFKPKYNELAKKDEYSIVALFKPGTDITKLEAAAEAVVVEKWGQDKTKWPKNLRSPFKKQTSTRTNKKGEVVPNAGHTEGAIYMDLKSTQRPGLVDQKVQPILDETEFYPGCWAIASLRAYAYDNAGNRGVSFGLQNIQKVKEGDPLAGRSAPESDFAPIEGAVTNATDMFK